MFEPTIDNDVTLTGEEKPLLIGRYQVVRQLGRGGMGSVWLAKDTQLDDKLFAVKMLPAILVSNKRAYRQLKDEAIVAMKLVHPNIVQIRAFEENNGNPFLVMDYVEGDTLDDILADKGKLSEEEAVKILRPIAEALDYAHAQNVVHRDIKPANVMIRKDGHPYILDFGIAREIQETMTRVTGKLSSGTLLYMSPEQLNGHSPKPAQDVYSFGAMAYECLNGEPPFCRGQIEHQILNTKPAPLSGGISIAGGIMAALEKTPERRPATCSAVLQGVRKTVAPPPVRNPRVTPQRISVPQAQARPLPQSRPAEPSPARPAQTQFRTHSSSPRQQPSFKPEQNRYGYYSQREKDNDNALERRRKIIAFAVPFSALFISVLFLASVLMFGMKGPKPQKHSELVVIDKIEPDPHQSVESIPLPQAPEKPVECVAAPEKPVERVAAPENRFTTAMKSFTDKKYEDVIAKFGAGDNLSFPDISFLQGIVYECGLADKNGKPDFAMARRSYETGERNGSAYAGAMLGLAYYFGRLGNAILKDESKGLQLVRKYSSTIEKQARDGDMIAEYIHGVLLTAGVGCPTNKVEGLKFLESSAKKKFVMACADLAELVEDSGQSHNWAARAWNMGYKGAALNLGIYYWKKGDKSEAAKWALRFKPCGIAAAEHGSVYVQRTLGELYEFGVFGAPNLQEAEKWYLEAANKSDAYAQYRLSEIYFNKKEIDKGIVYAESAIAQNLPAAINGLGLRYFKGEGVEKDLKKAKELFEKGYKLKNGDSAFYLGIYHKSDTGQFNRDDSLKEAKGYLLKAKELSPGNKELVEAADKHIDEIDRRLGPVSKMLPRIALIALTPELMQNGGTPVKPSLSCSKKGVRIRYEGLKAIVEADSVSILRGAKITGRFGEYEGALEITDNNIRTCQFENDVIAFELTSMKPKINLFASLNGLNVPARVVDGLVENDKTTPVYGINVNIPIGQTGIFKVEYKDYTGIEYTGSCVYTSQKGTQNIDIPLKPKYTVKHKFCPQCSATVTTEYQKHTPYCTNCKASLLQ